MRDTITFGIVGAGAISASHAQAIKHHPRAKLYAVCDIDPSKVNTLADKYDVEHRHTDLHDMLQLTELDVVCVCLPSGLHEAAVIKIAEARKHIFCEKPLDITLEKIDRMITAARNNGVKLGCAYQRRTMPEAIAARQAIREGKLGRMVLGDAYLKYYRSPDYYKRAGWRGTWQVDGGGALMNQGIHGIDLIQWLMGDITSVFAHTAALVHDIEVEDTAVVAVKYKNGAFGVIQGATSVYPGQGSRFELHGEHGSFIFNDHGIVTYDTLAHNIETSALIETINNKVTSRNITQDGHIVLINDFIEAIIEDKEPLINGSEARKAVAIIMAIYESSRTGKEVFL